MSDKWRDTETPPHRCPLCGHPFSAAGSPDGKTPAPGDLSVCISCASPLVFADDLTTRAATAEELARLTDGERQELSRVQEAVRSLDRREMPNE